MNTSDLACEEVQGKQVYQRTSKPACHYAPSMVLTQKSAEQVQLVNPLPGKYFTLRNIMMHPMEGCHEFKLGIYVVP